MKNERNIKLLIQDRNLQGGFDVFLDFSGKIEYLTSFKYSFALHAVLTAKEWTVGDLRREKPCKYWKHYLGGKDKMRKLYSSVKHLLSVIDWYLEDREEERLECA